MSIPREPRSDYISRDELTVDLGDGLEAMSVDGLCLFGQFSGHRPGGILGAFQQSAKGGRSQISVLTARFDRTICWRWRWDGSPEEPITAQSLRHCYVRRRVTLTCESCCARSASSEPGVVRSRCSGILARNAPLAPRTSADFLDQSHHDDLRNRTPSPEFSDAAKNSIP